MATIEPRLIHLLNNTQSPDIPPLQLLNHTASADPSLSLAPIENDNSLHRRDRATPQQIPPIRSIAPDFPSRQDTRSDGSYRPEAASTSTTNVRPLHQLRGDSESLQLPPFTHYHTDPAEEAATKKRQRALTVHQDLGPLPQPLKKRKSTQQVVPPIISGLHEPPQDAAVFPPIVGHYDDADPSSLKALKNYPLLEVDRHPAPAAEPDKPENKPFASSRGRAKRRIGKQRRKWSEQETNHLLLGVSKHGVGKWTLILEDPEYSFDERSAGDLKDRFRTCCPAEFQDKPKATDSQQKQTLEKILNEDILSDGHVLVEKRGGPSSVTSMNPDSDSGGPKKPKGRAHRKEVEDLEKLGINTPFKKSERRERRPFTDEDDREILEGLKEYGPSWTRIQRDLKFHLKNRQPTDLRDRVRNKFPDIYASIDKEKPTFQSIQQGRGTTRILEPSGDPSMGSAWERHLPRTSSRESMSRPTVSAPSSMMESFEPLPGISSFDMGDAAPSMTNGEEMAISRLMIEEEPQTASDYRAGGLDDLSMGAYGGVLVERQSGRLPNPFNFR